MSLNRESKYPSRRAYVVKLLGEAHSGAIAGRLEHLVSGRQHQFCSGEELLAWIARDLESAVQGEPGPDAGNAAAPP